MAADHTHLDVAHLCFNGPKEELTETINLQPAVTAVNLACSAALAAQGIQPQIVAGHSLGEYSALQAAGIISPEDTIRLVFKRGQLMHREATRNKGVMHALIGLTYEAVQALVKRTDIQGPVSIANHNTEKQVVITGDSRAVKKISALAVEQGAKSVPLKVSGAWHSQLIKGAEADFIAYMDAIEFQHPLRTVVHNVTAESVTDPAQIKDIMGRQLCSPVRWYDSICRLMEERVSVFAEIGPGKVLTGLVRKIVPRDYPCQIFNVNNMETLDKFLKETK